MRSSSTMSATRNPVWQESGVDGYLGRAYSSVGEITNLFYADLT